jgi:asparagine synthase (glutamine-hydrolysing)
MNFQIRHRGPNDHGEELIITQHNEVIGLAHRRLSILDLSPNGHQPMFSFDRKLSIVFNGEIYNYQQLNKELDYPFCSTCDTETILAAYKKWGKDCVQYLEGMFAFVIYDYENDLVLMARDRLGKKPLYYWQGEKQLVFASELKAIMEYPGFPKVIRKDIIGSYLLNKYITAPNTIFENVYKLGAGECLIYQKSKVEINKYWDIVTEYHDNKDKFIGDYNLAKDELKNSLTVAVKKRLISDVPVGSFLSGGYDSTLVTAVAAENFTGKMKSFAIGFKDQLFDEAIYAKEIADYLGTEHEEYYVSDTDVLTCVENMAKTFDEPFADNSQIPMMILSEFAKKDVSVALSGDGGDEFFCGYQFYDLVYKAQKLDKLGNISYPLFNSLKLIDKLPYKVREIIENRAEDTKTQFGKNSYIELCHLLVGAGIDEKYCVESDLKEANWQVRRMLLDMKYYMPDDILCKVDRATMKYALEARAPLLDQDLIKLSFQFPHSYKYAGGVKKRILKDLTYSYVPKEMLDRPKQGFVAPVGAWMRTVFKNDLIEVSRKEKLQKQAIFNPILMEALVDKYINSESNSFGEYKDCTTILWGFYMFQKWYREYIGNI